MSAVKPGTLIDGRYEVDSRLGRGGMGVVYRATQLGLNRPVAVKMLLPELGAREEDRVRFQREARVMSRLRHPNAVDVFDYGEWEGQLFLVMELLRGRTLRSRMVDGEAYGRSDTLRIGWEMADVLVAAHDLALVHRDVKPANIMLETRADDSERVVMVDFGLAFMRTHEADLARVTSVGLVSGTPAYMPPEQARGADDLGPPADVYALGVMLFELATGRTPFTATRRIDLLNEHLFVDPPTMREVAPHEDISSAFEELVGRMLAKSALDRPTAREVRDRIGEVIVGEVPRGRGRPERLNEERAQRVPTERDRPAVRTLPYLFDDEDEATSTEAGPTDRIGVVGSIDTRRHVALRAAGFEPSPYAADQSVDLLLISHERSPMEVMPSAVPVVALVDDDLDVAAITELLRSGIADVVKSSADDAAIVRKIQRALRSHRRRS